MACIDYPLCKYAHYDESGALVCETGAPCGFQRYCSTLLKVVHSSSYRTCKEAKKMDNERKSTRMKRENKEKVTEVEYKEEIQKPEIEIIEKKELCKARYSDGFIYINFKGYGLVVPNSAKHDEPELEVYYDGEIGKPDFRFRV